MQISLQYQELRNIQNWDDRNIQLLVKFLHRLDSNSFLRKSVIYLTFVQHCLPLHLCSFFLYLGNLKVFQQIPVYYDRSYLKKLFYK